MLCRYYQVDEAGTFAELGQPRAQVDPQRQAFTRDELARSSGASGVRRRRHPRARAQDAPRRAQPARAARSRRQDPHQLERAGDPRDSCARRRRARRSEAADAMVRCAAFIAKFLHARRRAACCAPWKDGVALPRVSGRPRLPRRGVPRPLRQPATKRRLHHATDRRHSPRGLLRTTSRAGSTSRLRPRAAGRPARSSSTASIPSGNAVAIETLLRLAHLDGGPVARHRGEGPAALLARSWRSNRFPATTICWACSTTTCADRRTVDRGPALGCGHARARAAQAVYVPNGTVLVRDRMLPKTPALRC